jgi:hypothetical protein
MRPLRRSPISRIGMPPEQPENIGASRADVRRLLIGLLRCPHDIFALSASEMDLALRVARRARVLGHLAARLEKDGAIDQLPQEAVDQLTSALAAAQAQQRTALWELDRVSRALSEDAPTRIIVLKGCAYALDALPNAPGRTFADVDLLFSKADLASVERRLEEHGWHFAKLSPYDQHYYRAWTHELPPLVHEERAVEVDLHHAILPPTARLAVDSEELRAGTQPIAGTRYERLADVDLVLHAAVHLFFDSDMADGLRDLVDLDVLLRHFSEQDAGFWQGLVQRGRRLGVERPVYYALRYAHRLLATPTPAWVLHAFGAGAPRGVVMRGMDYLVEQALLPQPPDRPSRRAKLARFLLYVRSHWIRMPPGLLARHLGYKLYARFNDRLPARG